MVRYEGYKLPMIPGCKKGPNRNSSQEQKGVVLSTFHNRVIT